jgi:hypothetical protein
MVIVIIFFDRPDLLSGALEKIRLFPVTRLHAVSDGPRADDAASRERVDSCRRLIEEFAKKQPTTFHYSTKNLGCQQRILSGLDEVLKMFSLYLGLQILVCLHQYFNILKAHQL